MFFVFQYYLFLTLSHIIIIIIIGVAVAEVDRVIIRFFWLSAFLAGNTVDHVVITFIESLFRIVKGLSFLRDMEIRLLSVVEDLLDKASNADEGRNGVRAGEFGSPVW